MILSAVALLRANPNPARDQIVRAMDVRDELAEAFRLPLERVRVIVPDTGSA